MSDRDALLLSIAADPAEDTPRLAFADWCEESGEPARAEFVRAGVRLAEIDRERAAGGQHHNGPNRERSSLVTALWSYLLEHEAAFRRSGPCPECGGRGKRRQDFNSGFRSRTVACPHCSDTGDRGGLMEEQDGVVAKPGAFHYRVEWSRGFPQAVHCTLADVLRRVDWPGRPPLWVPRPWALSVCRWWPVERFVLTSLRPVEIYGHRWTWTPAALPEPLRCDETRAEYGTDQDAIDALARRAAEVVRAALKEQVHG